MSGHTKGPWFTEDYMDGTIQICGDLVDRGEYEMSYKTIIEAMTPCPEVEANTSLVLAAPNMLSTLELVKRRLNTCLCDELDMGEGTMTRLFDEVSEAIARAKGEQA